MVALWRRPLKPVFIHISKNAGTSIIKSARRAIVVAGHRTAASWVAENGHDAPIFAVVRNPFDRVVSEYFFRKRRFSAGEDNPHLANLYRPFDDWVTATFRDGEFRTSAFFARTGVRFNANNMVGDTLIWFLPQTQWIGGADGEVLVDDILRYEHLGSDWTRFSGKHRIRRGLGHRNPSPREKGYQHYYSSRTRTIIEEYFRADLDLLDYQFG